MRQEGHSCWLEAVHLCKERASSTGQWMADRAVFSKQKRLCQILQSSKTNLLVFPGPEKSDNITLYLLYIHFFFVCMHSHYWRRWYRKPKRNGRVYEWGSFVLSISPQHRCWLLAQTNNNQYSSDWQLLVPLHQHSFLLTNSTTLWCFPQMLEVFQNSALFLKLGTTGVLLKALNICKASYARALLQNPPTTAVLCLLPFLSE